MLPLIEQREQRKKEEAAARFALQTEKLKWEQAREERAFAMKEKALEGQTAMLTGIANSGGSGGSGSWIMLLLLLLVMGNQSTPVAPA